MKATVIALVGLTLCATLTAQVPVEIVPNEPNDTVAARYVDALKQAVLTSPSFVLRSSRTRLRISPIVGGSVTIDCGEHHNVFRGVALLVTGVPSGKEAVFTSVFTVGEENDAASKNLLRLYEVATALGVPGTR